MAQININVPDQLYERIKIDWGKGNISSKIRAMLESSFKYDNLDYDKKIRKIELDLSNKKQEKDKIDKEYEVIEMMLNKAREDKQLKEDMLKKKLIKLHDDSIKHNMRDIVRHKYDEIKH